MHHEPDFKTRDRCCRNNCHFLEARLFPQSPDLIQGSIIAVVAVAIKNEIHLLKLRFRPQKPDAVFHNIDRCRPTISDNLNLCREQSQFIDQLSKITRLGFGPFCDDQYPVKLFAAGPAPPQLFSGFYPEFSPPCHRQINSPVVAAPRQTGHADNLSGSRLYRAV